MQNNPADASTRVPPPISSVQFYSVQLAPLEDGRVSVAIGATLCEPVGEHDFELFNLDMASERVETLDQALAIIRDAVISTMLN